MKKNLLAGLVSLLILSSSLAVLIARGSGSESSGTMRVGVTLLTQAHPFYQAIQNSMWARAKEKNVDLIVNIADQDLNKQISQIEDYITQQVDLIIITPVDSKGIKGAILKAKSANIPVITVDIKAEGIDVASHIATDNYTGGKIAAEAMGQYLGGSGTVGLLTYPEVQSVRDRISGFKDQAKRYPNLKIVTELPGRTREEAKSASEDMLTANKNLSGIFGFGDDMAIAATNTIAERNSKAIVIGFDGLEEARNSVDKDNAFLAVVKQEPEQMGSKAIDLALELHRGKDIPKSVDIVPSLYANKSDNVKLNLQQDDFGLNLKK